MGGLVVIGLQCNRPTTTQREREQARPTDCTTRGDNNGECLHAVMMVVMDGGWWRWMAVAMNRPQQTDQTNGGDDDGEYHHLQHHPSLLLSKSLPELSPILRRWPPRNSCIVGRKYPRTRKFQQNTRYISTHNRERENDNTRQHQMQQQPQQQSEAILEHLDGDATTGDATTAAGATHDEQTHLQHAHHDEATQQAIARQLHSAVSRDDLTLARAILHQQRSLVTDALGGGGCPNDDDTNSGSGGNSAEFIPAIINELRVFPSDDTDESASASKPRTVLMCAARRGLRAMVELLIIDGGADVAVAAPAAPNWAVDGCWTALHEAATAGHGDVARVLILHGADALARTSIGCTPLHLAAHGGHTTTACAILAAVDDVAKRVNSGAAIDVAGRNGGGDNDCTCLLYTSPSPRDRG